MRLFTGARRERPAIDSLAGNARPPRSLGSNRRGTNRCHDQRMSAAPAAEGRRFTGMETTCGSSPSRPTVYPNAHGSCANSSCASMADTPSTRPRPESSFTQINRDFGYGCGEPWIGPRITTPTRSRALRCDARRLVRCLCAGGPSWFPFVVVSTSVGRRVHYSIAVESAKTEYQTMHSQ